MIIRVIKQETKKQGKLKLALAVASLKEMIDRVIMGLKVPMILHRR